jgi:hypothetical protein
MSIGEEACYCIGFQELFPTREFCNFVVAVVAGDTGPKLFGMYPVHDLTENRLADMHPNIVGKENLKGNGPKKCLPISNRSHLIFNVSILIPASSADHNSP